jgi:hypothetical protein
MMGWKGFWRNWLWPKWDNILSIVWRDRIKLQNTSVRVACAQAKIQTEHLLNADLEHKYVRVEVFTVVTMKNGVFWDVMPPGSCKNRHFGGT